MATPLQIVQGILQRQKEVSRPPQDVCTRIAALKDLVEIGGAATGGFNDWRRGGQSSPGGAYSRPRGNGGHGSFRNGGGGGGSGGSGGSGGGNGGGSGSPLNLSIKRNTSYNSTASVESSGSSLPSSTPTPRYQSRFKNSSAAVESKILNNIILSKLNKFSPATYNDIREFLYQILGSGEPDLAQMIRDFMMLVFRKAASEEIYCALYAKLLAEISGRYTVILEQMHQLHDNYLDIFDDVEEVPEGGEGYDAFVEKNREKRYRQGYSQFLAELASLEILSLKTLEQSVQKLVSCIGAAASGPEKKTLVEEYVDCLVRMSKVLKQKKTPFAETARKSLMALCGTPIAECISNREKYPSLSPKARFLMMDVKDILEGK